MSFEICKELNKVFTPYIQKSLSLVQNENIKTTYNIIYQKNDVIDNVVAVS